MYLLADGFQVIHVPLVTLGEEAMRNLLGECWTKWGKELTYLAAHEDTNTVVHAAREAEANV